MLRAFSLDDFDAYALMWTDGRVSRFIGATRPRDEAWRRFCQGAGFWALLGYGFWAVEDSASGRFLGTAGLGNFERGIGAIDGVPEAGWAYAQAAWGRGIAGEALSAILDWSDARYPETRCLIDPDNGASVRVAERAGYKVETSIHDGTLVLRRQAPAVAAAGRNAPDPQLIRVAG